MGDTISKFILSAQTSGKEGFQRRVRKRMTEFVSEWRTMV